MSLVDSTRFDSFDDGVYYLFWRPRSLGAYRSAGMLEPVSIYFIMMVVVVVHLGIGKWVMTC